MRPRGEESKKIESGETNLGDLGRARQTTGLKTNIGPTGVDDRVRVDSSVLQNPDVKKRVFLCTVGTDEPEALLRIEPLEDGRLQIVGCCSTLFDPLFGLAQHDRDVGRMHLTLGACCEFVVHQVLFTQTGEAGCLEIDAVDEHVLATTIRHDKTVAFGGIEPLHHPGQTLVVTHVILLEARKSTRTKVCAYI